ERRAHTRFSCCSSSLTCSPAVPARSHVLLLFQLADLVDAALVASSLELGIEEDLRYLLGQLGGDDASADRKDVGVVVLARHPRRVQIVAERGAGAVHFVGRDLLALPAS